MKRTSLLLNKSRFHLHNANNAMNRIYPLVKENKVMIVALNNLFMAFNSSMLAVLDHAYSKKVISSIPDNFDNRLTTLKKIQSNKILNNKIIIQFLDLGNTLKELVLAHRNSSVEFSRGHKYVICDGDFQYKILSMAKLHDLYSKTKLFIDEAIRLTSVK